MSFPLLCDPTDGAENRAAADVSRSAPAVPLLASAQSISAPNGPLSAVRELAEALARRAADRAGFVAAAPPVPDGDGAVLLVGLWTSYAALRAARIPAALHLFETGGHGFGLRRTEGLPVAAWPALFDRWAAAHGQM